MTTPKLVSRSEEIVTHTLGHILSSSEVSRGCRQFKNIGLLASVSVIPAKAGTKNPVAGKYAFAANGLWIPAFAGMTVNMTTLPRQALRDFLLTRDVDIGEIKRVDTQNQGKQGGGIPDLVTYDEIRGRTAVAGGQVLGRLDQQPTCNLPAAVAKRQAVGTSLRCPASQTGGALAGTEGPSVSGRLL